MPFRGTKFNENLPETPGKLCIRYSDNNHNYTVYMYNYSLKNRKSFSMSSTVRIYSSDLPPHLFLSYSNKIQKQVYHFM